MLGHQVYFYFKKDKNYEIFDVSYRTKLHDNTIILDIKNKSKLEDTIKNINPDYIVNCIGILINGSESNNENAVFINAYLPHYLKLIASEIDAKLIQISTDCVFSGEKGEYIEIDEKDGRDLYSKTKALGEINDNVNLTIRTSIIGPELKPNGEGLFHWFMKQTNKINGYQKAIWSGVTTLELSKAIKWAIEENITGLYHITNEKSINKYELLNLLKKEVGKNIEIIPVSGKAINKSLIDSRNLINYDIPDYYIMIKNMVNLMREHRAIYEQYDIK